MLKDKQDAFCANALAGNWKDLGEFPEDLQWEALVDVLRGRVKVNLLSHLNYFDILICPRSIHTVMKL